MNRFSIFWVGVWHNRHFCRKETTPSQI